MRKEIGVFFIVIVLLSSCRIPIQKKTSEIIFSSIKEGQIAISKDEEEDFFEKINLIDMQLQMPLNHFKDVKITREKYKEHLKKSVVEFSEIDKTRLRKIFKNIENGIHQINPNIMPPSIRLIKVQPNHYGEGVYYTRENSIIIPTNVLRNFQEETLRKVLIHEIFHIYSRQVRKTQREKLYGLIHYKKLKGELKKDEWLQKNTLLNPDGLEENWFVELNVNGTAQKLVSLLVARENADITQPFFSQMLHRMYVLQQRGNTYFLDKKQYYTPRQVKSLINKIGNTTHYIIHPDEILAENFVLAVLLQDDSSLMEQFPEKGRKLVEELIKVLKET